MKVILHFYILDMDQQLKLQLRKFQKNLSIISRTSYTMFILCDVLDTSCKPRQIMKRVEVSSPAFYITYECSGHSAPSPPTKRCLHSRFNNLTFKYNHFGEEREVIYENHTSCEMKCVCGDCEIEGLHTVKCDEKFIWDNSSCDCVPSCKEDCKTNSVISKTNSEKGVSIATLVLVMVAELVIVLIAVLLKFDTCKCRKHSTGVLYGAAKYIKSATGEKGKSRTEINRTGSVSLLTCDSISTQRNT
ncbi:uncharacterized protein LOC100201401 isoform X1 [Hydra vulgaris]|uniref:uncharacterized protein LOC100201401 isoform X1 n=1 Tax=Hydra vulgaris TaxID=6087 RepID=UPI0032EA4033